MCKTKMCTSYKGENENERKILVWEKFFFNRVDSKGKFNSWQRLRMTLNSSEILEKKTLKNKIRDFKM